MSIIKEKRERFASALERARHSSSSSVSCISVDSLDAFSDPFSSELSECGSFLTEECFGDLFDPTKWTPSRSALNSLPPAPIEFCEWDYRRQQQHCKPLQESQKSLDLCCGTEDFLATAEDTMEVLSRIISGHNDEHNIQVDLIDMIDDRQCTFLEQISSDYVVTNDSLTLLLAENPRLHDKVSEEDPWLSDRPAASTHDLSLIPQFATISPRHISMDKTLISQFKAFFSPSPRHKSSIKGEVGITIDKTKCKKKKLGKQSKVLTPQDKLAKREKNRLRSKAYRERRKLQIKILQEEVVRARLETQNAIKKAKLSRKR